MSIDMPLRESPHEFLRSTPANFEESFIHMNRGCAFPR